MAVLWVLYWSAVFLEGLLGLGAKYWRRFIPPIVAATVVTSIGFSLLAVGANSFGGGFGNPNFGDAKYIIVGTVTLFSQHWL